MKFLGGSSNEQWLVVWGVFGDFLLIFFGGGRWITTWKIIHKPCYQGSLYKPIRSYQGPTFTVLKKLEKPEIQPDHNDGVRLLRVRVGFLETKKGWNKKKDAKTKTPFFLAVFLLNPRNSRHNNIKVKRPPVIFAARLPTSFASKFFPPNAPKPNLFGKGPIRESIQKMAHPITPPGCPWKLVNGS